MATPKRTGLGRGIGALIPVTEEGGGPRPVDVFFPEPVREAEDNLVAVPGAFLALVWALVRLGVALEPKMAVAIVTAASAPVAALTSMFAVRYDRDVALSAGLVSGTTLLSMLTMPPLVGGALWLFGGGA